jgi:ABC-type multidrug transport system, ATPase component
MIKFENISKTYGKEIKAVDCLNLEIPNGKIVGFIGPNGAGKTTTIKMLTGILAADEGKITVNNYDIVKDPLLAKKEFGFVPDNPNTFLRLKGIEYLNFIGDIYDVSNEERLERINALANKFNMTQALNDKIMSYSHGMRQKIMIMGALIHQPSIWILDEPLTGLDPQSSFELKEMMREHARVGKTVFFSTHVLEVAEKLCDFIAIINKGKIIFLGTLEELKKQNDSDKSLEEIFIELINHA